MEDTHWVAQENIQTRQDKMTNDYDDASVPLPQHFTQSDGQSIVNFFPPVVATVVMRVFVLAAKKNSEKTQVVPSKFPKQGASR